MSEEKDIASLPLQVDQPDRTFATVRAKSYKVCSPPDNMNQFGRAISACIAAGMSLNEVAKAGEFLGYNVNRQELDALIAQSFQPAQKIGEVVESEGKIIAWQNRGEVISANRLTGPSSLTGREIVVTSQDVITPAADQEVIEVLEGIAVFQREEPILPEPTHSQDFELKDNPYLKAVPLEIKKA